jgi:hypothetical protein
MKTYNGYKNHETWNVVLWLMNDEALYELARRFRSYTKLVPYLIAWHGDATPDGVRWDSRKVSRSEVSEVLRDTQ